MTLSIIVYFSYSIFFSSSLYHFNFCFLEIKCIPRNNNITYTAKLQNFPTKISIINLEKKMEFIELKKIK